ncbi:hypothetical protein EXIGLDRAFT_842419 [Exidia glandulosa HHB12029]|uniref:Aminoglycoside phosphotransferase domain-containing protein n=1 Tax=Exidia glandulosa HHB12029 TaxID=1314781 RepID=A0A165DC26_EXIGL|nr:hypothetical protein EXIGLDRAFT_842419 [Exidia glandulosa HHB12029]
MTPTPVSRQVQVVPSQSEAEILAQSFGCSVDEISPDSLTGVDIEALAGSACAALGLEEPVTVEVTFYRRGTFNRLYRLHLASGGGGVDVLVRIPTSAFRQYASVASTVANMLFAQHVCHIPVPRIIAWNDDISDQSQVPYIITDLVQAAEVWPVWLHEPLERKERIFESFARTQALFLRPLPSREFPLSSIGSLALKQLRLGGTSASDYVLEPLTIRHPNAISTHRRPKEPLIRLHSALLRDAWFELLEWHSSRCLQHTHHDAHLPDSDNSNAQEEVIIDWNREPLPDPEDTIAAPTNDFLAVVDDLRSLVTRTLAAIEGSDSMQPCLVRTDYAFRNVLLDPKLDTKACVDFDDVQIMPLVLAHIIPQDLLEFEEWNISRDAPYFTQQGGFSEFPPDEYGPEDLCPDDEGALASNERIRYTAYRTSYLAALELADPRIQGEGWWEVHRDARKVHELLVGGTHMWWVKREWLRMRREDSVPASVR